MVQWQQADDEKANVLPHLWFGFGEADGVLAQVVDSV